MTDSPDLKDSNIIEGNIIESDNLKIPYGDLYPVAFPDEYRFIYICGVPLGKRGEKIREQLKKIENIESQDIIQICDIMLEIFKEILAINYNQKTIEKILTDAIISNIDLINILRYLSGRPFPFALSPKGKMRLNG